MQKICKSCQQSKPIDSFHKDKNRSDGRRSQCKDCLKDKYTSNDARYRARENQRRWRSIPGNKERESDRRDRKREAELSASKRRNLETWPWIAIHGIRSRARKENRECSINPCDIIVPDCCPVLGIPIIAGSEAPLDNRPSVDRFDNSRGYTKDNIRVISYRANQLKRDATIDEVRRILHYMEGG